MIDKKHNIFLIFIDNIYIIQNLRFICNIITIKIVKYLLLNYITFQVLLIRKFYKYNYNFFTYIIEKIF